MLTELVTSWDELAESILAAIATYWVHSTLLLGGTLLICSVCRLRNPALLERLWKFAAVVPLITSPLALCLGVSIPGCHLIWLLAEKHSQDPEMSSTIWASDSITDPLTAGWQLTIKDRPAKNSTSHHSIAFEESQQVEPTDLKQLGGSDLRSAEARNASNSPPVRNALENRSGINVADIACLVIVLMVVTGMIRVCFRVTRLHFWLSRRPIAHEQQRLLEQIRRQLSIQKHIYLLESRDLNEPIACGWLHWRIVVPNGFSERLTDREWNALVTHEIAHLMRADPLWLLIGEFLCGCFPLQPLNFVARRRWTAAAEFLCDEWTVSKTADPFSLASCLTRFAEWKLDRRAWKTRLVSPANGSSIARRVECLLNESTSNHRAGLGYHWCLSLAGILCFLGLSVFNPLSRAEQQPGRNLRNSLSTATIAAPTTALKHEHPARGHDDHVGEELAELEIVLSRCTELATESEDRQVQVLALLLRERARLLNDLWRDQSTNSNLDSAKESAAAMEMRR